MPVTEPGLGELTHRGETLRPLGGPHILAPVTLGCFDGQADGDPFVFRCSGVRVLYVVPGDSPSVMVLDVRGSSALVRYRRETLLALDRALGTVEGLAPDEQSALLADLLMTTCWKMNADASGRGPSPEDPTIYRGTVRGGLPSLGKRHP